jgi:hypothetical protein
LAGSYEILPEGGVVHFVHKIEGDEMQLAVGAHSPASGEFVVSILSVEETESEVNLEPVEET